MSRTREVIKRFALSLVSYLQNAFYCFTMHSFILFVNNCILHILLDFEFLAFFSFQLNFVCPHQDFATVLLFLDFLILTMLHRLSLLFRYHEYTH